MTKLTLKTCLPLFAASLALSLVPGCSGCEDGEDGSGGEGGSGASSGTKSNGTNTGSTESTGTGFAVGSSSSGEACAQQSEEATLVNRPVDIIVAIDNSGSMSQEIFEVEEQINKNFASILDAANPPIDYRVILVAKFGASSAQDVCIAEPLGGIPDADMDGHCDAVPAQPVNTAKFFHHSVSISSYNALCRLVQQFDTPDQFGLQPMGYGAVLRPDSFKFMMVITDDRVSTGQQEGCALPAFNDQNTVVDGQTAAQQFDSALFTLSPANFGMDEATRNYRFWSIIALAPFNPTAAKPYGDPHPPDMATAPITLSECTPSAVNPGTGYQALSLLTGGYRYPSCGLDYTDMFQLMAQGVIEGAQVKCEFPIPEPPMGETIDLETVQVQYTAGDATVSTYNQVASAALCDPSSFYIENNTVILCPAVCDVVKADEDAKIDLKFGCTIKIE